VNSPEIGLLPTPGCDLSVTWLSKRRLQDEKMEIITRAYAIVMPQRNIIATMVLGL
jgi:hypothetical protein